MKGTVYKSYVRSAMLYGSETWYLKKNEVGILRTERYSEGDVRCKVGKQEEYGRRRCRLKGIHSRSDTNKTGPRVYPFTTPDCCTAWIRCGQ